MFSWMPIYLQKCNALVSDLFMMFSTRRSVVSCSELRLHKHRAVSVPKRHHRDAGMFERWVWDQPGEPT